MNCSLAGYSPNSHKDLDMTEVTEHIHTHTHTHKRYSTHQIKRYTREVQEGPMYTTVSPSGVRMYSSRNDVFTRSPLNHILLRVLRRLQYIGMIDHELKHSSSPFLEDKEWG